MRRTIIRGEHKQLPSDRFEAWKRREKGMSLFEDVQLLVGCNFISDICTDRYLETTKRVVASMDLTRYHSKELSDMVKYLYGKTMSDEDKETIIAYLKEIY